MEFVVYRHNPQSRLYRRVLFLFSSPHTTIVVKIIIVVRSYSHDHHHHYDHTTAHYRREEGATNQIKKNSGRGGMPVK